MLKSKVLIIGLDGATWKLMGPWIDSGDLPVLADFVTGGVSGLLTSTMQPMSAQAWTSFMTGKNIGKHGLVDFFMRREGSYDLQIVNASVRHGKSIWRILGDRDRQVCVINVPMTYPPEQVNGLLISGMDAPYLRPKSSSNFTWPREFAQELLEAIPDYVIEAGGHNYIYGSKPDPQRFVDEMMRAGQARLATAKYMLENKEWDLFTVVFRPTDRAQHWFWKHMDPRHPLHQPGDERFADTIKTVYRTLDGWVGQLLEMVDDDTTVIIMSDHGFQPLGNRVLYLNTWLRDSGFLSFRTDRNEQGERLSWSKLRRLTVSGLVWPAWQGMKRHMPTSAKRWLKKTFPKLERKVPALLILSDIDWARTSGYAMEVQEGNIFINLKGREPEGIVEPGIEYEALREDISRALENWRDPFDGSQVVRRVFKREELFHGPNFERTPDLLIQFNSPGGYGYQLRHGVLSDRIQAIEMVSEDELLRSLRPNASHELEGICIMRGPAIQPGKELVDANIVDLAPTALYLLGEPIPEDMDGRVLSEAFSPSYLQEFPPGRAGAEGDDTDPGDPSYDDTEQELIEDRLRGLGYL